MRKVVISGAIGLDVTPADVRRQLDAAMGEAVEIEISSPGGFVTDGLEIFNLIANYAGPTVTRLMGIAASMASYIALAAGRVIAEGNSVFMIHNAEGGAIGDHRTLRDTADIIKRFSGILASAYAEKSGKSTAEITSMMDRETWFDAREALAAGFVDEVVGEVNAPGEGDTVSPLAAARSSFASAQARLAQSGRAESSERIAAFLNGLSPRKPTARNLGAEDAAALAAFERWAGCSARSMEPAECVRRLREYLGMVKPLSGNQVAWYQRHGYTETDIARMSRMP